VVHAALTLRVSAARTPGEEARPAYIGTYEVDLRSKPLGTFAGHVSGGSGVIELSRESYLLVLNGLLRMS
jgi:hypothetical protein